MEPTKPGAAAIGIRVIDDYIIFFRYMQVQSGVRWYSRGTRTTLWWWCGEVGEYIFIILVL